MSFPTKFTSPGNSDYSVTAQLIDSAGCKIIISEMNFEASGDMDSWVEETTINLSDATSAYSYDDSYYSNWSTVTVFIKDEKPITVKRTNYKKTNLQKIRNTTSEETKDFDFNFNNRREATNLFRNLEKVIEACKDMGK